MKGMISPKIETVDWYVVTRPDAETIYMMIIVTERKNQIATNQVLFSSDLSIFVYDLSNL